MFYTLVAMPSPERPPQTPDLQVHGADPIHIQDVAFGRGSWIELGVREPVAVEYFPEARVARLTTTQAQIELYRQDPPQFNDELLIFSNVSETQRLCLTIDSNGTLALHADQIAHSQSGELPAGHRVESGDLVITDEEDGSAQLLIRPDGNALERPPTDNASSSSEAPEKALGATTRPEIPDEGQTLRNDPLAARSSDSAEEIRIANDEDSRKEQQPRLTILGRVGRTPRFRETRKGTKIASFPVAVPEDDGSTTWRKVTVFNERAEELAGMGVDTGDRVEVIGYLHERQRRRRDGTPYISEELYAAVIKLR